jgi:hypothetical protein
MDASNSLSRYREARSKRDRLIDSLIALGGPQRWPENIFKQLKQSSSEIQIAIANLNAAEFKTVFGKHRHEDTHITTETGNAAAIVDKWIKEAN